MQRLRDQIKTWQGDSSIKDKTKLDSNRKLIEEKMEKFKVCEKETKTKAFSKEGLAQDRTDPRQKAKSEINDWVGDAIRKIQEQSDEMEAEIETLNSGKRRKRAEENPRVTQLKELIARNDLHILMLERVLRAVDNDAVEVEEVTELRDSVEYYVESNQDPDFMDDDEMYDALQLDSIPVPVPQSTSARKTRENDREREETPAKKSASPKSTSKTRGGTSRSSTRNSSPNRKGDKSSTAASSLSHQSPAANGTPVLSSPRLRPGAPLMSSVVKSGSAAAAAAKHFTLPPEPVARQIFKQKVSTPTGTASFAEPIKPAPVPAPHTAQMRWNGVVAGTAGREAAPVAPAPGPISVSAAATSIIGDRLPRGIAPGTTHAGVSEPPIPTVKEARRRGGSGNSASNISGLGVYSKAPAELAAQLAALERSHAFLPDDALGGGLGGRSSSGGSAAANATASAAASPRNPAAVPDSFPHVPSSVFEKPNIFLKFDPDTLFFIFYYQQGTYQQYLAAKELKRQGWRFHKKYLTWFQRHDEPKVCNDEYETGTFIYFDYANVVFRGQGSGWCQRIKTDFAFHYRYLEDEQVL